MIDPDFWSDEKLGSCTRDERLLFMGLISNSDDEGRGRANSKLIKSTIFPYDNDLKSSQVEKMLFNLCSKKMICIYIIDDQEFYFLPNFKNHQIINRPTRSKIPEMPETVDACVLTEDSLNTHGGLTPNIKEKKIREVNINKYKYGEFKNVLLSSEEYMKLSEKFPEDINIRIENLSGYIASKGISYKSHYATILQWANKEPPKVKSKIERLREWADG